MSLVILQKKSPQGFTLPELITILSIIGILCSIAIPAFSSWLPEYRLRNAARDLYSSMQLAKTMAIKENDNYKVVFDIEGEGSYRIIRPDGTNERTVSLKGYEKSGGIRYGGGKATKNATASGGSIPSDGVSYQNNKISFTPRGLGSGMGYAYLENKKGTSYAIGSWISGIIVIKKWHDNKGEWD